MENIKEPNVLMELPERNAALSAPTLTSETCVGLHFDDNMKCPPRAHVLDALRVCGTEVSLQELRYSSWVIHCFPQCCDKTPNQSSLGKEGLMWAHSSREQY